MHSPLTPPVLDLLFKSTALLLLAFAAQAGCRRASAEQRGFIWLATFAALALLPLTLLATPRLPLAWLPDPAQPAPRTLPGLPEVRVSATPAEALPTAPSLPADSAAPRRRLTGTEWLVALWLAGAALVVARRAAGALALARLRKHVQPVADPAIAQRADRLAREAGVTRSITLRQSPAVPVPVTWGSRRPVLLLPAESLQWDRARLDAALRHELGHIRHHDALKRGLAQVVCALHWFNPLAWIAAQSWRTAQEQACDDFVLRHGADAETYAMQLLDAARSLGRATRLPEAALAMAQPSTLETRLSAIVDPARDRRPASSATRLACAAGALLLLSLSATLQLRAEEKKTDAPADPAAQDNTILIESRILEGPAGTLRALLGAATPTPGNHVITPGGKTAEILAKLEAAKGLDLLSAPRVTTRSGQKATIQIGQEIPAGPADPKPTAFVGIQIAVVPTMASGVIDLDFKASISEQTGVDRDRPVIHSREVGSRINLNPGSTVLVLNGAGAKASGPREQIFLITASLPTRENQGAAPPAREAKPMTVTADSITFDRAGKTVQASGGVTIETTNGAAKGSTATLQVQPPPAAAEPAALKRAKAITIPQVNFRDASPDEAVDFFRTKSAEIDPEKKGLNLLLIHSAGSRNAKLSLSLREVPLNDALRYVAALSGLEVEADDNALVLKPAPQQPGAAAKPAPVPAPGVPGPTVRPPGPTSAAPQPDAGAAKPGAALERAKKIVLQTIEFREASIDECLEFLRTKSAALDPEKQGVNLVLRPGKPAADAKLSLSLKNVSLADALRYIAQLAGLQIEADDHAIVLQPAGVAK